jgi:rhodanese-related sulfurtransferase
MSSHTQISVNRLQRLIGTPNCPVIVDVCLDEDFDGFPYIIPTAVRIPFTRVQHYAARWENKHVVVVCQKGLKLSEGAAAVLRAEGVSAEHLQGGINAWRDADAPLVSNAAIPQKDADDRTVWVTRSRPKIDRIACPWLIRRFIDPTARFLFVSGSQVAEVADRFSAIAFDIDQAALSHREDQCTFDAMLQHFGLQSRPLQQLAVLVRAADTNQHQLSAEAAGLLAVSVGLSRMYRDDLEQLEAGMLVYDALYRWARDGMDEKHDSSIHMKSPAE